MGGETVGGELAPAGMCKPLEFKAASRSHFRSVRTFNSAIARTVSVFVQRFRHKGQGNGMADPNGIEFRAICDKIRKASFPGMKTWSQGASVSILLRQVSLVSPATEE